jgi:hypothetical protein
MSTRSRIGIENSDGTVTSVYCHFDGYYTGVGRTLHEHYKDRKKVKALIDLGDLSYVSEEVAPAPGQSHSFGNGAEGVSMAYHRDRGDDFNQRKSKNREEFFKVDIEDYAYLFTQEDEWMSKKTGDIKTLKLLADILKVLG